MAKMKGGDDKFTKKLTKAEEAKFRREYKISANEDIVISDKNIDAWRKKKTGEGWAYSTKDKAAPAPAPKREEVTATLKTKKLEGVKTPELVKRKDEKKEETPKFKPQPGSKRLSSGGKSTAVSNVVNKAKNAIEKKKFEKEAKGYAAYKRQGDGGATSSDLKETRKVAKKMGVSKSQMKDMKTAQKFASKQEKGKTSYFGRKRLG